jgi:hypothetical protein
MSSSGYPRICKPSILGLAIDCRGMADFALRFRYDLGVLIDGNANPNAGTAVQASGIGAATHVIKPQHVAQNNLDDIHLVGRSTVPYLYFLVGNS